MTTQVELAQAVTFFQENMPALIAKLKIDAKLHRAKYAALLEEGFTDEQALELCRQF